MRKLLALSIVFAALLPLTVLADGPKDGPKAGGPRHHQPFFLKWDQNKDGVIAKDDKRAEGFFNRLDKNKDGKVCKKEIGDFFQEMKKRHEERAKQMAKDGKKPDFKKDSKACPYKKDCKKDGKDCPHKKDCKACPFKDGKKGPCPDAKKDGHHKHHGHHGPKPGFKGPRPFPPFDPAKAAEGFFNKADLNKDGNITKDELTKFFVEGQKKFKEHMEQLKKDGKKDCKKDAKKDCKKDAKKGAKKGPKPEKKAEKKAEKK